MLYGLVAIAIVHNAQFYIMKYIFGLVSLTPMDEIFLHEDPKNACNAVTAMAYEKFNYEEFSAQILRQGYE